MYYARMGLTSLHHRRGFTLIEMSIVVTIIGILAGAIVATKSYVRNSQLSTSVQDAQYYISAFGQFTTTYGTAPGDFATASSTWATYGGYAVGNGDGNGFVRAPAATDNKAEYWYAFQHLSAAQLIQGTYTGVTGSGGTAQAVITSTTVTGNVPQSSADGTAFLFDHPDSGTGVVSGDSLYFDGTYLHVLRLAGLLSSDTGLPLRGFLSPKEAYELDAKYDDGNPGMGWITTPNHTAAANCNTTNVSASSAYNIAYGDRACWLIFKLQ